jgi:2-polyprenyl-6-methoxyphenol hydroxylase-like FAD-dependent oxidoreductase
MPQTDVLIVGAGPTGLVLALWLTKLGARVRIIDKAAEPGTTSRAVAVQARTLELYRQLDLTETVLAAGHKVPAINLWVQGRQKAHVPFDSIAGDITPYGPFIFPQDEHERLLIGRLESMGVAVERRRELISFAEAGDHVDAVLRGRDGGEETCQAAYIAGCDGASSRLREIMGTGFPGGTYEHVFYVADVDAAGPALNGDLHVDLDESDFLAVFPLNGTGRARLIGTVRGDPARHAEALQFDDVSERAITNMKVAIKTVNWFSTYHVHHRVTEHFRKSRAFLLGDAAHIHSPAGGQGMNTGIGDAINLAWKLKAVLDARAPDRLLDTYETERRAFARKLVATTDKAFTLATAEGRIAEIVRTRLAPLVLPALFEFEAVREYLFGAVSQATINYRDSAISRGHAGKVHGGDRLPWAPAPGADNFDTIKTMGWQVHVYGAIAPELEVYCRTHGIPLYVAAWSETHGRAGFTRDAMYLVRPDSYVALAEPDQKTEALTRYVNDHVFEFRSEADAR